MYILASKFRFLEFRLLLSRVAPYYSSSPRTVWYQNYWQLIHTELTSKQLLVKPRLVRWILVIEKKKKWKRDYSIQQNTIEMPK